MINFTTTAPPHAQDFIRNAHSDNLYHQVPPTIAQIKETWDKYQCMNLILFL